MKFFSALFKKKTAEQVIKEHEVVTVDYLKVITPSEIGDVEIPPFKQSHYGSEDEYRQYLESVQELIDEYENTGTIHSLSYDSFEDVSKNYEEQQRINKFKSFFLSCGNWINAEKTLDSKYIVCSNGRHRMYIAKKYGLKLIIHVCQEQID